MKTEAGATHLADIISRESIHMEFYNALVLEAGGGVLVPARSGRNFVCHHPWPPDMIVDLVSSKNLGGKITNSDLDITDLVLHKATLQLPVPTERMAAPRSSSDNTPTTTWSTCEVSTIKPVVADFLHI